MTRSHQDLEADVIPKTTPQIVVTSPISANYNIPSASAARSATSSAASSTGSLISTFNFNSPMPSSMNGVEGNVSRPYHHHFNLQLNLESAIKISKASLHARKPKKEAALSHAVAPSAPSVRPGSK